VNSTLLHALYVAVPVGLGALLYALFARADRHPPTYSMSEPWTHPPILWAATDEALPGGHDSAGVTVGGGASGRW